jgi:ribosomal protein L11 methyltransferase
MPWLAVTLQIDAALAGPMSDALLDAGAQSVAIDHPEAERPSVHALLAQHADAAALVSRAADECGLPATPTFGLARVDDEDWVRRTQAQFAPLTVGERLWVGAHWHSPPPGRRVVRLDPGLAFGTGSHPTTRLVLAHLETHIRGGERVLDYGCGSGILAIAAARLGAALVDATDIDPQAVETTAQNAAANGVQVRAALPEALPAADYDCVISNILSQPLILLAPLLAARTSRGGRMALSGVLNSQSSEVIAAYAPWIDLRVAATEEGWALLAGTRR